VAAYLLQETFILFLRAGDTSVDIFVW